MSTKKLFDILPKKFVKEVIGNQVIAVRGLTLDSRQANGQNSFVAKRGSVLDSHQFIDAAISQGCTLVFCAELPHVVVKGVTYVIYTNAVSFIGQLAHNYYGQPSKKLKLIGVTGTNGKSTVVSLLFELYRSLGYKVGLLSTIVNKVNDKTIPSTLTTPDPISLSEMMAEMVEEGCEYAFMEVSSHALDQGRTSGLDFSVALFTNLTHDHLDYHGNFMEYLKAKQKLFNDLSKSAIAITNIDDKNGKVMAQNSRASLRTYSLYSPSEYKGKVLENSMSGLNMEINGHHVLFRLSGKFNAYNLLAVYATALETDHNIEEVLIKMSALKGVEGRMDKVFSGDRKIVAVVDYAHTPDALMNVLTTIRQSSLQESKLISVVGCGGDRDKTKRPKMAKLAATLSDLAILTSDNPRTEDPEKILDDMEAGLEEERDYEFLRITDRKQAIKAACRMAKPGDVILVAGKGHEKYQEINGKRFPFDDKKVLAQYLG